MNAIEILRAASRSVPNEDYVQFMAAVDAVGALTEVAAEMNRLAKGPSGGVTSAEKRAICARMDAALANVGGAA